MDIARGYAIGTLAIGVILTVVGVQLTRHRPGWRGRYRKGTATIVLGGFLTLFGFVDLVFDSAGTTGSVLRGVLSAASLLVGVVLAVGSFREYAAHPEWNRNNGPHVPASTLGIFLVIVGAVILFGLTT